MNIWQRINPDGRTELDDYRKVVMAVLVALPIFITRDIWLADSRLIHAGISVLAVVTYVLIWCVTVRRLRDGGQSTLFGWCFIFGGAIIPIVMGLYFDSVDHADGQIVPPSN